MIFNIFVQIKKQGKKYLALCPFHPERTPSFTVDLQKRTYRCFGCGKEGKVAGVETWKGEPVIAKIEGLEFGIYMKEKNRVIKGE
jgi:DNA primase